MPTKSGEVHVHEAARLNKALGGRDNAVVINLGLYHMFERWLKRVPRSEPLDLTRHRSTEFVAKTVTLEGREYVIGGRFREGPQGFAHRLVNKLSGLCQHAIQIRLEYMQAPAAALAASNLKAEVTANVREGMRSQGEEIHIPFITVHQGHGGNFELHETGWGMLGEESAPPAASELREAVTLMSRGDHAAAIVQFERIIAEHPYDSVALSNLSACHAALGDYDKALAMCTRAVEVEPNFGLYRAQQVMNATNCPRRYLAASLFDDLQARYPGRGDFDYYGIHAYLRTGQTEKAEQLLGRASLQKQQADDLRPLVEKAVRARERFSVLESQMFPSAATSVPPTEDLVKALEDVCADSPSDPYAQANLGLALGRIGEHKRAADLLFSAGGGLRDGLAPYCWTNAGYCLLATSDWKKAFMLFTATMNVLKGGSASIAPCDVPRVATWIGSAGIVRESSTSAADLLSQAIATCPDPSLINADIREMEQLLRTFESQLN